MKKKSKSLTIEDGIYFPSDFRKLPKNTIIVIKKGTLIIEERKKQRRQPK